jgi:hypothetical protein
VYCGGNATYSDQSTIYSTPDTGGPAVRLPEGEDLAIDPAGRLLLIRNSNGLVRLHLPSGTEQSIVLPAGILFFDRHLSPSAVAPRGRVILAVVTPHDFYYKAAIADGRTDTVIPAEFLEMRWPRVGHRGDVLADT